MRGYRWSFEAGNFLLHFNSKKQGERLARLEKAGPKDYISWPPMESLKIRSRSGLSISQILRVEGGIRIGHLKVAVEEQMAKGANDVYADFSIQPPVSAD